MTEKEPMDKKTKIWVGIIILVALLISFYPAIRFDRPVVQTDGASQYIYSKTLAETGNFNADNPPYNQYSSVEKKIGEYPPLLIWTLGGTIWLLGKIGINADIMLINGVFLGIFFVIALWYFYLLAFELSGKRTAALISLILAALSVRAYYTMFVGHLSPMLGFCVSIPALYYCIIYARKKGMKNLSLCLLFNTLTLLAYPIQALFILLLELAVWIGIKMQRAEIKVQLKGIENKKLELEGKSKELTSKNNIKEFLQLFIPLVAIIWIGLMITALSSSARTSWIKDWISGLLSSGYGYPNVWNYFVITDGPIFVLLAIAGGAYVLYKQDWPAILLGTAGILIVTSKYFLIKSPAIILIYVNRFLVTYQLILAILIGIVVCGAIELGKTKNEILLGKTVKTLLIITIIIQLITVATFLTIVKPAISADERDAAKFLKGYGEEFNILYVDNVAETTSFRAFKWVIVNAKSTRFDVVHELSGAEIADGQYDIIYISDYKKISDKTKIHGKEIFSKGTIRIFESR